jgi:hypothetical protein
MKIIALILLSLTFILPGQAQENCPFMTANSPSLLGLKLNMSPEQAQSVFGKDLKIKVKKNTEKRIFQNYIDKKPPASLAGVRALYLRFYNRRLYQIEVFYEERNDIKTLKDFTGSLSAVWNFPAADWREEKRKAIINCGEFTIVADKILNPRVELTDEPLRAQVEAEEAEKEKKEKNKKK